MSDLSVTMVCLNEERTIGDVIRSVKPIAQEIIVVDSGSTDSTISILNELGVKSIHQDWLGYAAQKNLALSKATSSWILSLDADEIPTPELIEEIRSLLSTPEASQYAGFRIPRLLYIGSTPIKHGGFYPDAQLRLIQNGKGQFNDRAVHEAITVNGKVGRLKAPLLHMAYQNLTQLEQTLDKYARLSAQHFALQPAIKLRSSYLNELVHPGWTFFWRYFIRGGFLDGVLGFKISQAYSNYVKNKIRYLRDALKQKKAVL